VSNSSTILPTRRRRRGDNSPRDAKRVGVVERVRGRWVAVTMTGDVIGTFDTRDAAEHLVAAPKSKALERRQLRRRLRIATMVIAGGALGGSFVAAAVLLLG
jgi:hypothetical protein